MLLRSNAIQAATEHFLGLLLKAASLLAAHAVFMHVPRQPAWCWRSPAPPEVL
jgi:hypothetical protein